MRNTFKFCDGISIQGNTCKDGRFADHHHMNEFDPDWRLQN